MLEILNVMFSQIFFKSRNSINAVLSDLISISSGESCEVIDIASLDSKRLSRSNIYEENLLSSRKQGRNEERNKASVINSESAVGSYKCLVDYASI